MLIYYEIEVVLFGNSVDCAKKVYKMNGHLSLKGFGRPFISSHVCIVFLKDRMCKAYHISVLLVRENRAVN